MALLDAKIVLDFADGLVLLLQLSTALVEDLVLRLELLEIGLQVEVATLEGTHAPDRILFDVLELDTESFNLNRVFLNLVVGHAQLLEQVFILALVLTQRLYVPL